MAVRGLLVTAIYYTTDMIEKIQKMLAEISTLQANSSEEVDALRIKYLSKKGEISALMADFRNVPADMKKEIGMKLN